MFVVEFWGKIIYLYNKLFLENIYIYSKSFTQPAKIKALKIHKHKCFPKIAHNNFWNDNSSHRYIIWIFTHVYLTMHLRKAWNHFVLYYVRSPDTLTKCMPTIVNEKENVCICTWTNHSPITTAQAIMKY